MDKFCKIFTELSGHHTVTAENYRFMFLFEMFSAFVYDNKVKIKAFNFGNLTDALHRVRLHTFTAGSLINKNVSQCLSKF